MSKIIGIGGVFLTLKGDPIKLAKWYRDVFKMDASEYGISIVSGNHPTLLTFNREENSAIINFVVDDIEKMMTYVKDQDIKIVKEIEEYPYGKFSQIEDLFGNIIELWEPYMEEYLKMVKDEMSKFKSK